MQQSGNFVISLDFEIYWGVRDKRTIESYRANLLGVRKVIPSLLEIFAKHHIRATFATVGFLFFRTRDELLEALPGRKPLYADQNLSPYNDLDLLGETENDDPFHFGHALVKMIKHSGQEIGSHTFSHYYCLENGQTLEDFKADLRAAKETARMMGLELKSLVFPRNQFNEEYLEACREEGFTSYRGNENSWFYTAKPGEKETFPVRSFRMLDSYLNISGHNCFSVESISDGKLLNIPSSRFLRPYSSKLKVLEKLRLKRILDAMTHAAKNNLVYHLWWHPHNFGTNLANNLDFLEKILNHYDSLAELYNFKSVSMTDLADQIQSNNEFHNYTPGRERAIDNLVI